MPKPTFPDYIAILRQLFRDYQSSCPESKRPGRPYTYAQESLVVFFAVMTLKHNYQAKAQHRWLQEHPDQRQAFVAWIGDWAEDLDESFRGKDRFEDKSLFKALGPVWHQKDRKAGRIPNGLRNLDKEATWSKSEYQGWVYGYAGHWTTTPAGFPRAVEVETACVSEAEVIDRKAEALWEAGIHTLTADNAYCNLARVRTWAEHGVVLITPALKVSVYSPQGGSYKEFVGQAENVALLRVRKTATEPLFDLIAKLIGAGGQQKQLLVQGLARVRTCLAVGTLLAQVAMIVNSIWGMPLHNISHMMAVIT